MVNPESLISVSLPYSVMSDDTPALEFRLLVYLDGVEMDRKTIDPLLIKEPTIRDGEALAQQAGDEIFSITLFIISLISVSFALWMLVVSRRMKRETDQFDESHDQTEEVDQLESSTKQFPDLELSSTQTVVAPQINNNIPQLQLPIQPAVQPAVLPLQPIAPIGGQIGIAPLPPTGLPPGWTMEQWSHYGWKYIEALQK